MPWHALAHAHLPASRAFLFDMTFLCKADVEQHEDGLHISLDQHPVWVVVRYEVR